MSFRDLHRRGDPFILANAWDAGSALARVTHGVIRDAAAAMFGHGDFSPLSKAMPRGDVDRLLG